MCVVKCVFSLGVCVWQRPTTVFHPRTDTYSRVGGACFHICKQTKLSSTQQELQYSALADCLILHITASSFSLCPTLTYSHSCVVTALIQTRKVPNAMMNKIQVGFVIMADIIITIATQCCRILHKIGQKMLSHFL